MYLCSRRGAWLLYRCTRDVYDTYAIMRRAESRWYHRYQVLLITLGAALARLYLTVSFSVTGASRAFPIPRRVQLSPRIPSSRSSSNSSSTNQQQHQQQQQQQWEAADMYRVVVSNQLIVSGRAVAPVSWGLRGDCVCVALQCHGQRLSNVALGR